METVTLSSKYQLVLPRATRERLRLQPGMKLTVLAKGGVIFLVPDRPMRGVPWRGPGSDQPGSPREERPPLILVDSSGWIEYLADRPRADRFARYPEGTEPLLVSAIEVYR
jgi:AbrB family looped-hinge helix DNA binding protein